MNLNIYIDNKSKSVNVEFEDYFEDESIRNVMLQNLYIILNENISKIQDELENVGFEQSAFLSESKQSWNSILD